MGGDAMRARGLGRIPALILLLALTAAPLSLPATTASAAPQLFAGVGTATATAAIDAFRTSIGGVNNGVAPPPAVGGRREINWDGVAVDGSVPGSVVIVPNQTVGIPTDLFQPRGVTFDRIHAVSADSFVTVNPGVAGQFPPFSPTRTFASFNNNTIVVNFVLSSARGTAAVPAGTRGFGAVFLDVESANSSSIEYFAGATSLGRFFVPAGPTSQPEFLGVLFDAPVVTSVRLTVGAGTLFSFHAPTVTPGSPDVTVNPVTGIDQVALDDFIYAEPTASVVPTPVIAGGPNPLTSGQTGTPCADTAGQSCVVSGGVTGSWTEGPTHPFNLTATGPAATAPGSTPRVFLPTTNGVESFPCNAVGVAAPFVASCAGSTVGDLLQGATVTIRFALFGGGFVDVTGTVTGPGPAPAASLTVAQAIALVQPTGQQGASCASAVGQNCQAAGGVNGPGTVTGSMRWALTANVPAGVAAGVIPVAVFSTNQGLQGFACAAVVAGVPTVACNGTTAGNALQGSTVTVVFAAGVVSVGTITGPGVAAVVAPLLPPPPPIILPPPPSPLIPVPSGGQGMMGGQNMPGGQGMMGGQTMPAPPSRSQPAPTATPVPDASRAIAPSTAAQTSPNAAAQTSPNAAAAPSDAPQAMPAGAPPMRPTLADAPLPAPSVDVGVLTTEPALPTTLSPSAPAGMAADPASMMPAAPDGAVSSVVTAPSDTGDDTLQDLPIEP
jgi:hypothetical protein